MIDMVKNAHLGAKNKKHLCKEMLWC